MEWKLEVVSVPITDVDRAKDFYAGKMGFNLDHDSRVGAQTRVVWVFDSGLFRPSREGEVLDNVGFVFFGNPTGNGWALQQVSARGQLNEEG